MTATLLRLLVASAVVALSTAAKFDVTAYGAVGDGSHDDTAAIAKALSAAAAAATSSAPATVLVPAGKTFLTGPLNMSSFMTLEVEGTLKAKSGNNTADGITAWPQLPPLPSYGNSRDNWGAYLQYQAFVYAHTATDIAINGTGTIDGSGEWWWGNLKNRSAVPSGWPNLIQFVNVKGIEVCSPWRFVTSRLVLSLCVLVTIYCMLANVYCILKFSI